MDLLPDEEASFHAVNVLAGLCYLHAVITHCDVGCVKRGTE